MPNGLKNKTIKNFYFFLILVLFFSENVFAQFDPTPDVPTPDSGGGIFGGGPSISVAGVLDQIEKRYGYDKNVWRRGKVKAFYPKVELFFDKTNPKEGEMVTASAIPAYFRNTSENLYFTWYIVHKDDAEDGVIDIEEAKREAMGKVARGNFNPVLFGTRYDNGGDDPDHDGFDAPIGGKDGVGAKDSHGCGSKTKRSNPCFEDYCYIDEPRQLVGASCISRCYEHNFGLQFNADSEVDKIEGGEEIASGKDRIIECKHDFAKAKKGEKATFSYEDGTTKTYECDKNYRVGDSNKFTTNEEFCWRLDPENPDTDGDGIEDEADLAGLAQNSFRWEYQEGDLVGVIVEGTAHVPTNEGKTQKQANELTRANEDGNVSLGSANASASATGGSNNSGGSANASTSVDLGFDVSDTAEALGGYDAPADEEDLAADTSALTPYYKIMWAGIEICNEHNDGLFVGDNCDDEHDYGYHFYALKPVNEEADSLIENEINYKPINPQFDSVDEEYSDTIEFNSTLINETLNTNFVYYEWDIFRCKDGDIENCPGLGKDLDEYVNLTKRCEHGDLLEECTKQCVNQDGKIIGYNNCNESELVKVLESDSHVQGMGVNEIKFKPKKPLIEEDRQYFNVFLKTKHFKEEQKYFVSRKSVPVTKNNLKIKLYKTKKLENGKYGFDSEEDEICKEGLYKTMCPVFPYQVLAAKAEFQGEPEDDVTYNWKLGENLISPPLDCEDSFQEKYCDLDEVIYFPILEENKSINTIGVVAKRGDIIEGDNGEDLISQRIFSINPPAAAIKTQNPETAWQSKLYDETEGVNFFETEPGNKVEFKASMIPDYLEIGEDVYLDWYLNGTKVTEDFIKEIPEMEIEFKEDQKVINYKVLGKIGNNSSLSIKTRKLFSFDELRLLQKNWDVLDVDPLEKENSITIKKIYNPANEEENNLANNTESLKLFFASTVKNAPGYLIFTLRLSVMLMIIWGIILGADYIVSRPIKSDSKK